MLMRTTLVCFVVAANSLVAFAADGDCKSTDPAIAIPACTKQIEAATADAKAAPIYFDRAMAHIAQFFLDGGKFNAEARACFEEDNDATIAACGRLIDNPAADPQLRSTALFERSKLLSAKGQGAEAIADFKRTMEEFPAAISEPFDRAMADFNKAIELDGSLAVAYAQRGDLYLSRQQEQLAVKDFNKAIEIDPKQMLALFGRALVRNMTSDPVGAVADLKAVIALSAVTPQEKWMQEQAKQQLPKIGAD